MNHLIKREKNEFTCCAEHENGRMESNKLVEQLQQLQEKKWKKWVETFEDEDTHEMVDIECKELLTTETSDEEREVWQQIIPELPKLSDEELNHLQYQVLLTTDIDSTPLVEVLAERGDELAATADMAGGADDGGAVPADCGHDSLPAPWDEKTVFLLRNRNG